jgi:pyruvate dehydrogenase E2 component (dihydrolipoamide acetyltransferase)
MAESKATAPDFVMTLEVDMEEAFGFRRDLKVAAGDAPAPSFNDLVIKASALALRDFPRANGAYRDGQFQLYSRVNVGVAVAGQDALVVPTVFDADRKSLGTIAAEARHLAERVREGKITPPELSAGTFTISNLGMYGIRRFVAVLNPPQAAIWPSASSHRSRSSATARSWSATRWSSPSPATTGSSTAPRPPSSCRGSASTCRPR